MKCFIGYYRTSKLELIKSETIICFIITIPVCHNLGGWVYKNIYDLSWIMKANETWT